MNTPANFPSPDPEHRLDAWLASRPIVPAHDFVVRTIARIHAEESLMAAARAGDDNALDTLLDSWLAEQPIEPSAEPGQVAISTRRGARQDQKPARQTEAPWRRTIAFPVWARSFGALAAAAAVMLMVFMGGRGPVSPSSNLVANNVSQAQDDESAAPFSWAYQAENLESLDDSLSDGAPLLDSDNADILLNAAQDNGQVIY